METKTDKHNTAATRKSNAMDYILLAIGCSLIIYGAIDWHFFTKQQRAELDACHKQLMECYDESGRILQESTDKLKALNADNQSSAAEEK